MNNEVKTFAKSVTLRLIDDDLVGKSTLTDIEVNYCASEIVYLFQNYSHVLYDVVIAAAGAFFFYILHQKKEDNKAREELIRQIHYILKEHDKELRQSLKNIQNRINIFDKRDREMIIHMIEEQKKREESEINNREIEREIISKRKQRLSVLSKGAKRLTPSKKSAHLLLEIMEKEHKLGRTAQEAHVEQFRSFGGKNPRIKEF